MGNLGLLTNSAQGVQNTGLAVQGFSQAAGGVAGLAEGYGRGRALDAFGDYSADLGERNAEQALLTAEGEAQQIRFETRQRLAILRGEVAASGVAMSGTPLALLAEQAAQAAYQAKVARYGGSVNATQARAQGRAQQFQYRLESRSARQRGWGSMLGGFGQAAGSFVQMREGAMLT